MVYNYRKFYKYNKNKRFYKKTLRKSNIFSKRSSRSQARQIYALNKKVNYIQKTQKPELQTRNYNIWYRRFLGNVNQPLNELHGREFFYEGVALNPNTPEPNRIVLNGNLMRVKFIKFFGEFGIYNDTSLEGDWAVAPTKRLIENDPSTAYLRIVVCRMKKGGGRTPTEIFESNPNETDIGTTAYDCSYPMIGPLVKDVTSQFDIIKNKVIKVDISKPFKMFSFKLNAKKLGYVYRRPVDVNASGQNELLIYWCYCCPAMLNYQSPQGVITPIGPQAYFSLNYNIGYVDQN